MSGPQRRGLEGCLQAHREAPCPLTGGVSEPAWRFLVLPGALSTGEWLGGIAGCLFHSPSALNTEGNVLFSMSPRSSGPCPGVDGGAGS